MSNATMDTTNGSSGVASATSRTCPLCGSTKISPYLTAPDRFHLRWETYNLLRCGSCETVWLDGPPKPEEMGEHYDHEYHQAIMSAGEGDAMARWKPQHELIARYKQGGSLLDLGCSSGGFLSTMKNGKWKLHGIEMEKTTAEAARARTGADVFVGDVLDAPFPPGSFDLITSFDVLEHVYDPPRFLAKIREMLKPDGIFLIMIPNIDSWESRMFGSYWYGLELPRHLFHFSPTSLRNTLKSSGFRDLSVETDSCNYLERSLDYISGMIQIKAGSQPIPQSRVRPAPSLPYKIVRKGFRLSAFGPFGHLASMCGAGASIHGVFAKDKT